MSSTHEIASKGEFRTPRRILWLGFMGITAAYTSFFSALLLLVIFEIHRSPLWHPVIHPLFWIGSALLLGGSILGWAEVIRFAEGKKPLCYPYSPLLLTALVVFGLLLIPNCVPKHTAADMVREEVQMLEAALERYGGGHEHQK